MINPIKECFVAECIHASIDEQDFYRGPLLNDILNFLANHYSFILILSKCH